MIEKVSLFLKSNYPNLDIDAFVDERNIVFLTGDCKDWNTVVDIGHGVARIPGVRSVVNDITVLGVAAPKPNYADIAKKGQAIGEIDDVDVVIIGGGVSGTGIARELSRYNLQIALVEKGEDVASGATKANNGDVHSGYLEKPGTLKAELNVKGNAMYTDWAKELNFAFRRNGNILFTESEEFVGDLEHVMEQAEANKVPCEMVDGDTILELEPLMKEVGLHPYKGIFVPSMGTVDPWEVAIALAENAAENGVRIYLDTAVGDVLHNESGVTAVVTEKGIIRTKYVINCAGVYADDISDMAGDRCFTIHPRKGTIAIIDKNIKAFNRPVRIIDENRRMIGNEKTNSKGGGMATTISKNNLLGPSAEEVADKEDMETTVEGLDMALERSCLNTINRSNVIRFFSGSRPATYTEDFYICLSEKTDRFINVAGMQSPGLAAAPAVAKRVISILFEDMDRNGDSHEVNETFNPYRKKRIEFSKLTHEEKDKLIQEKPEYGRIICRCESITEGEILDVIHSPVVPASVDAIKRRTRAGMGRCQGGFCGPRVLEILANELNKDMTEVQLKGKNSEVLIANNRK